MENLRTKTFWIGILAFPVILVGAFVVPILLEDVKEVRRYAILDRSGWLAEAIEERAGYDDLLRLLRFLRDQVAAGEESLAQLPPALRQLAPLLAGATEEHLEQLARMSALQGRSLVEGSTGLPANLQEQAEAQSREVLDWMLTLSPAEARQLDAGINREDYERLEVPPGTADPEAYLRQLLGRGPEHLFAYFVIGEDPVLDDQGCKYVSNNFTDDALKRYISRLASAEVQSRRIREAGIDRALARHLQAPLVFENLRVTTSATGEAVEAEVETRDVVRQFAPIVFVYLLWVAVFTIAQMLLTNTIEEKSNRVIEVLLSSVSPLQLMTGKILGIAATGLTVLGSWIVFFLLGLRYLPVLMGHEFPLDLTLLIRDPVYLASFVAYFLLGYLLFAALLVGFGSVCNSLKEAQHLMQPLVMVLIVPLLAMIPIGKAPNGALARVLTYIPPFTPFVMMNRAAGPPPLWEYVATTILLVVSILLAFWVAAKVFRVGILMTGKPPRFREILRWIRTPVGVTPPAREPEAP
jgi:ABC-type Na+ efflux pump permease subunit